MIRTLSSNEAAHILYQDDNANWSYEGAKALVDYLEQLEEDLAKPLEMDFVAIRCDYSEYDSLYQWAREYFGSSYKDHFSNSMFDGDNERNEAIREYLEDNTTLIEFSGGIIVGAF